ncbi:MAG: hypothetical protein WKF96_20620 [Solirubrobacteraceae bacterium]
MAGPRDLSEFSEVIRSLPARLGPEDARRGELELYRDDKLSIYYAPFDFVNHDARIAVVGVTPGPTQILESLTTVRDTLKSGGGEEAALRRVKQRASFKGMRHDLSRWMDQIGLAAHAGVETCATLFDDPGLFHTTSAIRYPTFSRKRDGSWVRYSGTTPDILGHPELVDTVEQTLLPELLALPSALIVPLGKANRAVAHLVEQGKLERERCIVGLPHPSPASPNREQYFQRAKRQLLAQVTATPTRNPRGPERAEPLAPEPPPRATSRRPEANSQSEMIEIELTQGNLNNNHIYLRRHLSFFPSDAIGQPAAKDGTGAQLTVTFAGLAERVETDIAGGNKLFLRSRAPVAEFFRRNKLKAGDSVRIERLAPYEFRVSAV